MIRKLLSFAGALKLLLSVCVAWVVIISPASANETRRVAIIPVQPSDKIDQDVQKLIKEAIYLGTLEAMKPHDGDLLLSQGTIFALLNDMGIDLETTGVEAWAEVEVGRALGVNYVVDYSLVEIEDQILVSIKIFNTNNGQFLAFETFHAPKTEVIELVRLATQSAQRVIQQGVYGIALLDEAEPDVTEGSLRGAGRPPGSAETIPQKSEVYDASYAVVVGIDKYEHLPHLDGAVRDAEAMTSILEERGFNVTKLINEDATKQNIERVLWGNLQKKVGPSDRVLIYFAGHGVTEGEDSREEGFLMPVEATEGWQGLEMVGLQEDLNRKLKAKHILYLADACYSGLGMKTRSVPRSSELPNYLQSISEDDVHVQLTAGKANQEAHEYRGRHGTHGLFTYYLLEGLRGAADNTEDGVLTTNELWTYLRVKIGNTAQKKGWDQSPQMSRAGEGEFMFFLPQRSFDSGQAADVDSTIESGRQGRYYYWQRHGGLSVGDTMPTFAGHSLQGQIIRSADLLSTESESKSELKSSTGGLIVSFVPGWAPPLTSEYLPALVSVMQGQNGKNYGAVVVGVSPVTDVGKAQLKELSVAVILDTHRAVTTRVMGKSLRQIPRTYIINREGTVCSIIQGYGPHFPDDLAEAMTVGCPIVP